LQCATFAQQEGEPAEVVAACLLHDFGHLLHDLGEDIADHGVDARHERLGANKLSKWFGTGVVEPVRLHAESKRYLCWKEPGLRRDRILSAQCASGVTMIAARSKTCKPRSLNPSVRSWKASWWMAND